MSNLERFNNQSYNFFKDLSELYPDDKELIRIKKKLWACKLSGSLYLYKEFVKNVLPHKNEIIKRNEKYLLDIDNIFVNRFKNYYITECDKNKSIIWDYLSVLLVLSEKIFIEKATIV